MRATMLMLTAVAALAVGCAGSDEDSGQDTKPAPKALSQPDLVALGRKSTVRLDAKLVDAKISGSGAVIDAERGLVLSNAHVVTGASAISALVGDEKVSARVEASAPCEDLAVLALDPIPDNLSALEFGSTEALREGERVTALGYPKIPGQSSKLTATDGNLAAKGVSITIDETTPKYSALLQHQATINAGSSGGPLVNSAGKLVGLNTIGASGEVQDTSYAIDGDYIQDVLPDIKAGKDKANPGWFDYPVSLVDELEEFEGIDLGPLPASKGLLILGTGGGSPADRAGFNGGDIVLTMEDTSVEDIEDKCEILRSRGSGSTVKVAGISVNGNSFNRRLKLR
ncbi:MAG: S1C family serine protease [Actinomycetota bacterium]|nr:S1C family serine protease [Actinomycetota bacterium]